MAKAINIQRVFKLADAVELYKLHTCQNSLCLSDGLQICEENSPNKPPFAINYLEYYDCHEPVTSWIIRHIFAYTYQGQHPFFESFADTFLRDIGFNMEWIEAPVIYKDHEYKSIDILVRDKQYAIIIENKLKGAYFQLNQLARYIATMRDEGYTDEQIFVVVLPKDDIDNDDLYDSVWKLPKDWKTTNTARKCRIDDHTCWCDNKDSYKPKAHCAKCESLKTLYEKRTLFIHKELSEWIYDCFANNSVGLPEEETRKQYVLKSAALQFVDFLNYQYKTRENDKYKMDIKNFLAEQLKLSKYEYSEQLSLIQEKIQEVDELSSQLNNLYSDITDEYIKEIGTKHQVHIIREDNNKWYFHCEILIDDKKVYLSVGYEKDNYCQIETKGRIKIPEVINDDFFITEELNERDNRSNCIWRYDTYLESVIRFDRVLNRLIELKNKKKK